MDAVTTASQEEKNVSLDSPPTGNQRAAKNKSVTEKVKKTALKKTPSHPPVAQMVNAAITQLKDRGGSSIQAIKKYISANYKIDTDKIAPFIKKYLKNSVAGGTLIQTKGKGASGSFKLVTSTATGGRKTESKSPKKKASTTVTAASSGKTVVKKAAATTTAKKSTTTTVSKKKKKAIIEKKTTSGANKLKSPVTAKKIKAPAKKTTTVTKAAPVPTKPKTTSKAKKVTKAPAKTTASRSVGAAQKKKK